MNILNMPPGLDFGLLAQAGPSVLDAVLKSLLLLALAALVTGAMRRSSAAARHLVWLLAVMALFALPALSWTLPVWNILPRRLNAGPPVSTAAQNQIPAIAPKELPYPSSPSSPSDSHPNPARPASSLAPQSHIIQAAAPAPSPARFSVGELWLAAWLAGFAYVILRTLTGVAGLWLLERRSRVERASSWLDQLRQLAAGLGLRRPVLLLKSQRRQMPMTWGVIRPRLLLPENSEDWPQERRRLVLLHELAHMRRWDCATNFLTRLACAVWWFNPLVWLAARQMAAERERACDDIVLNHGASPARYAEQILQIAAGLRAGKWTQAAGIAMTRPANLEARLRAILDTTRQRSAPGRRAALLMLAASLLVLVPVAMLRAASAVADDAPQTEVVFWQFFADKALVEQLFPGQFPPSHTNAYTPIVLDSSNWFAAIQAAQQAGGVEAAECATWLEPKNGMRILQKISMLPNDYRSGLRRIMAQFMVNGFYKFDDTARGAKLDLSFSLSSSYSQLKNDQTGFVSHQGGNNSGPGEIKWRGTIKPGQALVFPSRLKGDLTPERFHIAIFQAVTSPRHLAPDLRAMTSAPRWLADGPAGALSEIRAARAWEAAAATGGLAQSNQFKGPAGTPVQIVAIAQTARWPLRWWDTNGRAVIANPAWQQSAENAAFGVLIRRGNLEGTLDCGLRLPDDAPSYSISLSSGAAFKPADRALYLISYPPEKLAQYFDKGGRVDLVVTYGIGEWQEIGAIHTGETRDADGGRFTLGEAQKYGDNCAYVDAHFDYDPGYEIAFAAVNKRGKRSPVPNLESSGHFAQRANRQTFVSIDTDKYDLDHFAILKRPAKEFVFPALPTSPRLPVTNRMASSNEPPVRASADAMTPSVQQSLTADVDELWHPGFKLNWEPIVKRVAAYSNSAVPIITNRLSDNSGSHTYLLRCLIQINTDASLKPVREILQDASLDGELITTNRNSQERAIFSLYMDKQIIIHDYPANREMEIVPQLIHYSDYDFAGISFDSRERLRLMIHRHPSVVGRIIASLDDKREQFSCSLGDIIDMEFGHPFRWPPGSITDSPQNAAARYNSFWRGWWEQNKNQFVDTQDTK